MLSALAAVASALRPGKTNWTVTGSTSGSMSMSGGGSVMSLPHPDTSSIAKAATPAKALHPLVGRTLVNHGTSASDLAELNLATHYGWHVDGPDEALTQLAEGPRAPAIRPEANALHGARKR